MSRSPMIVPMGTIMLDTKTAPPTKSSRPQPNAGERRSFTSPTIVIVPMSTMPAIGPGEPKPSESLMAPKE